MSYNEDRPRKKGKPHVKKESKKNNHKSSLREVSVRYDYKNTNSKSVKIEPTLQSLWPSLVEYVGLSEYEAKIYIGLVSLGSAGARRLSLNCDVPRTKVYGTLKKLIDYGLVIEVPGSPKTFISTDPRNAFSTLLELQHLQAKDFSDILNKLGNQFELSIQDREPEIIYSWILDDSESILEKCIEFIRNTNKVLTIVTDENGLGTIFNYTGNELDNLSAQGATVKIFSPLDPQKSSLARELNYIHTVVKRKVKQPIFLLNSDNSKYILAKTLPRDEEGLFEYGVFGESPEVFTLIDLLLSINGEETIRIPIMSL